MNKTEILQKAITTFGIQNQLDMLTEEIGELLQAINKLKRAGGLILGQNKFKSPDQNASTKYSLAYFNLCSEVADTKIMLAQLELMLCPEAIKISETRKLERLEQNLPKQRYCQHKGAYTTTFLRGVDYCCKCKLPITNEEWKEKMNKLMNFKPT